MTNGLHAGGNEPNEMSDHGFMQQRSIEDYLEFYLYGCYKNSNRTTK